MFNFVKNQKLYKMKKILAIAALAFCFTACSDSSTTESSTSDSSNMMPSGSRMSEDTASSMAPMQDTSAMSGGSMMQMKDGAMMMKDGKMMMMTNGKMEAMTKTMTCTDGCKVMTNGQVVMKDGKKMMMTEGMSIDKDGNMMGKDGKMMDHMNM
jgi:PBP1b-binding outer membrane lipoprotein LpoB